MSCYLRDKVFCDDLNKNDPHMLEDLLPSWWNFWGRVRRCDLLRMCMLPGTGHNVSEDSQHSQLSFSGLVVISR